MTLYYTITTFVLWVVLLLVLVLGFVINGKKLKDTPQDDSKWNINYDSLRENLRRFVSNKNEKIETVLGKANALKLLNSNINKAGFCILSDKAFYFVGRVYQKKWIFSFRSNIQHRIPITEMKGIKVGTVHRFEMFLFGFISVVVLIAEIKRGAWMWNHEDLVEVVNRMSSCAPFGSIAEYGLVFGIILALILSVSLVKRTTVCIELDKITVNFFVCELGKQEIKDFYRIVSDMQNNEIFVHQNMNVSQENANQVNVNPVNESFDRVTKLTELSQLYEKGLLQQEEFERLKSEIIET